MYLLSKPTKTLVTAKQLATYGALYEDVKRNKVTLPILTFHNVRLFTLIALMVLMARHPVFQSTVYAFSAILSLAWDWRLRPYRCPIIMSQVLFLDLAKLAAAAGFVVLTVPTVDLAISNRAFVYETVVLLVAIGGGMLLVLFQVGGAAIKAIMEACRRRENEGKIYQAPEEEAECGTKDSVGQLDPSSSVVPTTGN